MGSLPDLWYVMLRVRAFDVVGQVGLEPTTAEAVFGVTSEGAWAMRAFELGFHLITSTLATTSITCLVTMRGVFWNVGRLATSP